MKGNVCEGADDVDVTGNLGTRHSGTFAVEFKCIQWIQANPIRASVPRDWDSEIERYI